LSAPAAASGEGPTFAAHPVKAMPVTQIVSIRDISLFSVTRAARL
jgi:hypothetical protein